MGLWDSNLNSENWGTAIVLKQLKWSNKIPSNLKPRKYLPLYELLALCQANTLQFYVDCAQVVMEGSGTANATFVYFQIGIYQGGHPSEDPPGGAVWSGCE